MTLNQSATSWLDENVSDWRPSASTVRAWRAEVSKADRVLERWARVTTKKQKRPSLMSVSEAAAALGVTEKAIEGKIRVGDLKNAGSSGTPVAIPRADVERIRRTRNASRDAKRRR